MPPLSLTHLKYASVERPISEKSVPGCFVLSAPILIGAPLAFWPLPSPHLDVGPAALAGVEVSFAPPPLLLSLLSPQAGTREATPTSMTTSPASDRGVFQPNPVITVLLLLGLLESNALAMRSLRAQRYVRRTLLGRPTRCQGVTPGGSGTPAAVRERVRPRIRSAAFSAIINVGAFVFPRVMVGITEASTTRRPSKP